VFFIGFGCAFGVWFFAFWGLADLIVRLCAFVVLRVRSASVSLLASIPWIGKIFGC